MLLRRTAACRGRRLIIHNQPLQVQIRRTLHIKAGSLRGCWGKTDDAVDLPREIHKAPREKSREHHDECKGNRNERLVNVFFEESLH